MPDDERIGGKRRPATRHVEETDDDTRPRDSRSWATPASDRRCTCVALRATRPADLSTHRATSTSSVERDASGEKLRMSVNDGRVRGYRHNLRLRAAPHHAPSCGSRSTMATSSCGVESCATRCCSSACVAVVAFELFLQRRQRSLRGRQRGLRAPRAASRAARSHACSRRTATASRPASREARWRRLTASARRGDDHHARHAVQRLGACPVVW